MSFWRIVQLLKRGNDLKSKIDDFRSDMDTIRRAEEFNPADPDTHDIFGLRLDLAQDLVDGLRTASWNAWVLRSETVPAMPGQDASMTLRLRAFERSGAALEAAKGGDAPDLATILSRSNAAQDAAQDMARYVVDWKTQHDRDIRHATDSVAFFSRQTRGLRSQISVAEWGEAFLQDIIPAIPGDSRRARFFVNSQDCARIAEYWRELLESYEAGLATANDWLDQLTANQEDLDAWLTLALRHPLISRYMDATQGSLSKVDL